MELTIVLTLVGALLVRAGHGAHQAGMVRSRSVAATLLAGLVQSATAVLGFTLVGAALLMQTQGGVGGLDHKLLAGLGALGDYGPGAAAALLAVIPLAGATAERARFWPIAILAAVVGGVVSPAVLRWAPPMGTPAVEPQGWLLALGFYDFGGAAPIGLVGGTAAAVAAWVVGPRFGKYNRDGSTTFFPGHALTFSLVGAAVAWAGWLAYAAGRCSVDTTVSMFLAAPAGLLAGVIFGQVRFGKPDPIMGAVGLLGSAVAIVAAGPVPPWAAVVIGAIAGAGCALAAVTGEIRFKVDDPTYSAAIFAVGTKVGLVAAALFWKGTIQEKLKHLGVNVFGIVVIVAATAAVVWLTLRLLKLCRVELRVPQGQEFDGLDLAAHDLNAYPDFQQTMIKSHHLRQA